MAGKNPLLNDPNRFKPSPALQKDTAVYQPKQETKEAWTVRYDGGDTVYFNTSSGGAYALPTSNSIAKAAVNYMAHLMGISSPKSHQVSPEQMRQKAQRDAESRAIWRAYEEAQKKQG